MKNLLIFRLIVEPFQYYYCFMNLESRRFVNRIIVLLKVSTFISENEFLSNKVFCVYIITLNHTWKPKHFISNSIK